MTAYRICERRGEKLLTLFHAINGSREMPMGVWLDADIKPVRDASATRGKEYLSGFHCMESLDEMRAFKRMFRKPRDLVIVECEIEGNRRKTHSRANVILADRIKLNKIIEKIEI